MITSTFLLIPDDQNPQTKANGAYVCAAPWMPTYLKRRLVALISLLPLFGVIGITVRLYWNLTKGTDLVIMGDESRYLIQGSKFLHESILPRFSWSPLYACWYAVHLRVLANPIATYYAQIQVVSVLTAILMHLYLRMIGVPKSLCVLGAVLWIAQPAYVTLDFGLGYPRPYHFAFLVFLAGATALRTLNFQSRAPFALAGTAFMLPVVAVRQEYLISLVLLIFIIAFWVAKLPQPSSPQRFREYLFSNALLVAVTTLMLWMILKGPAHGLLGHYSRSWVAFGQHFSVYRLGNSGGGSLDPWRDWEIIMSQVFPGAHSVVGAALVNPKWFLSFELYNVFTVPRILYAYLTMGPYPLLKGMAICLTIVWISFITLTDSSLRRHALATAASALGPFVLSGAATALPVTLITPKISYFLPLLFVLFATILKGLSIILESEPERIRTLANLFAVVLSLMFVVIRSPFDININSPMPHYLEVTEIRSILEAQKTRSIRMLQGAPLDYGYTAFLPYGLSELVDPKSRRTNELFGDFINRQHIEAVLVDTSLATNRLFIGDSDFALLRHSPDQFGWMAVPVGTQGDLLYLRDRRQNYLR